MKCPDCHGEGRIALFVSSKVCSTCGGTGVVPDPVTENRDWRRVCAEDVSHRAVRYEAGSLTVTGEASGEQTKFRVEHYPMLKDPNGIFVTVDGFPQVVKGVDYEEGIFELKKAPKAGAKVEVSYQCYDAALRESAPAGGDCDGDHEKSRDIYAYPSGMDDPYRMEAFQVVDLNQETTPFFCFQQEGRAAALYCGTSNPNETAIQGPVGSLYTRDDGGAGSLWVKTGTASNSWSQLQTTDVKLDSAYAGGVVVSTGTDETDPDLETALDQFREACSQYEELRTNLWDCPPDERDRRHAKMAELVVTEMSYLAPMLTANFANAMCILGQEGEDVVAFISSVRNFADVLSWSNDEFGLERSAEDFEKASLFGIPFVKSATIPAGYAGAVSTTGQIVLMTITR